jgi:hypothetical protein
MTCPQQCLDKERRSLNIHPLVDQLGQKTNGTIQRVMNEEKQSSNENKKNKQKNVHELNKGSRACEDGDGSVTQYLW